MRNNETGEFELVVGNRQLLSAFFIVVLLFAVAFAMGYVVGQNSPRSAKMADATAPAATPAPTDARPQPAPPPAQPAAAQPAAPADSTAASTPGDTDTSGAAPQPSTQPARETPAAPATTAPAPAPAAAEERPGSYWQVMAVEQAEADIVVRALKDKGFPAQLTQGPKNLMRVLVGPYNDTQSMGKAKTELEKAGFHPIRK